MKIRFRARSFSGGFAYGLLLWATVGLVGCHSSFINRFAPSPSADELPPPDSSWSRPQSDSVKATGLNNTSREIERSLGVK